MWELALLVCVLFRLLSLLFLGSYAVQRNKNSNYSQYSPRGPRGGPIITLLLLLVISAGAGLYSTGHLAHAHYLYGVLHSGEAGQLQDAVLGHGVFVCYFFH